MKNSKIVSNIEPFCSYFSVLKFQIMLKWSSLNTDAVRFAVYVLIKLHNSVKFSSTCSSTIDFNVNLIILAAPVDPLECRIFLSLKMLFSCWFSCYADSIWRKLTALFEAVSSRKVKKYRSMRYLYSALLNSTKLSSRRLSLKLKYSECNKGKFQNILKIAFPGF